MERSSRISPAAFSMSTLPWLGVGKYTFVYPGSRRFLPELRWPEDHAALDIVHDVLATLYGLGEIPLHLLAQPATSLCMYVYFPGGAYVRPFVFFVFWFGLTIVFGASRFAGRKRGLRDKGS